MSEMTKELSEHYLNEANKHAEFLVEKVFKPAFVMAFIHGTKHGREDLAKELLEEADKEIEKKKTDLMKILNSKRLEEGCI